jgi:hypothetical protein
VDEPVDWGDARELAIRFAGDPLGPRNFANAFLALDALVGEMAEALKAAKDDENAWPWEQPLASQIDALIARARETRDG